MDWKWFKKALFPDPMTLGRMVLFVWFSLAVLASNAFISQSVNVIHALGSLSFGILSLLWDISNSSILAVAAILLFVGAYLVSLILDFDPPH